MRSGSISGLSGNRFHRLAYVEWGELSASRVVVCVHGLTRNGRDFDSLARALAARGCRVVCPDMPGRGESDWLEQAGEYDMATYLTDMTALLARLDVESVDWVGTSMGGLIGMMLAAKGNTPIHRLVLNDIGAVVEKAGLERIRGYVGAHTYFASREEAFAQMRMLLASFGPLSEEEFTHLAENSIRLADDGGVRFHYDPAIGEALRGAPLAEVNLWPVWDALRCPVLVLRGADSDLLSAEVAAEMTHRGPGCRLVTFPDTGHAPSLMAEDQLSCIIDWLLCGDIDAASPADAAAEGLAPPLDVENLRSLFRSALDEALSLFLDVARDVADGLPSAVAERDAQKIWATGHKLVGSSRMAGATALVTACEDLCAAALAADWLVAEACALRLIAEVARIEGWVRRWHAGSDMPSR